MKKITIILFSLIVCNTSWSQGIITGFTVSPSNPTTNDNVKIYVGLEFSSGGCLVDNSSHTVTGDRILANGHHCIGMLSVICPTIDTFNLGILTAGSKLFKFTLTSGFGQTPCTPGFVPDDIDSVSFVVSQPVGIKKDERGQNQYITIAPNPFYTATTLTINSGIKPENASLKIVDIQGSVVRTIDNIQTNNITLERGNLLSGIYFYQFTDKNNSLYIGKLLIE